VSPGALKKAGLEGGLRHRFGEQRAHALASVVERGHHGRRLAFVAALVGAYRRGFGSPPISTSSGGMAIPPPVPKLSVYEGQSLPDRRLDGVGGRFRFAAEQQPYPSAATRDAHDHLSALQGGTGAPLARQRGGRPRWRDTRAESTGASTRRRSCGRGGVDARGPRRGRRRPAGQGRCSGGWRRTRPQTEPAESEERDPRQDPPATNRRPYVTFAGSPGAPLA
jgi:hypothetical protein